MNIHNLGRMRRFGAVDRALLLISVICSFIYLITQRFQPYPGSVLLKVLSVASLAVIAFRAPRAASARPRGIVVGAIKAAALFGSLTRNSHALWRSNNRLTVL